MSIALSIPFGMFADRFNIKKYAGVGLLFLGPFALLRGFTNTFPALMLVSIIASVGWVIFFTSIPRVIRLWFPLEEVGTAMGVVFSGYGVGSAVGVAFAQPLFGSDWRSCFALLGIWGVVAAGLWWLGAKENPTYFTEEALNGASPEKTRISSGLKEVLKVRAVWVMVAIFFFYIGGRAVWLTFSFPYLVTVRAIPESIIGYVLMLDWIGYIAGSFLIAVLSDRLGLRRPFFFVFGGLLGLMFLIFPLISSLVAAAVYAFLVGLSFGAINPLIFVVCAESADVGEERTGSATGVLISFANIGALAVPTAAGYILGSLDESTKSEYGWIWLLVALSLLMMAVFALALKETGPRRPDA